MILIGSKVYGPKNEEFTVIKSLGTGGFGHVLLVENLDKNKKFALKTANADGMTDDEYIALLNEGELASSLENENVIKIHYFHDGKEYPSLPPYLLMDYAEGGSLRGLLDTREASKTHFTIAELRSFMIQICIGMKAINEKLLHRDLHPGNVLLLESRLKISDFGLSKLVDVSTRTRSFKGVQHILYKAPESWTMQKNTVQMDMYSAGIIFYELAALKYPYTFPGFKDPSLEAEEAHKTGFPQPLKPLNSTLPNTLIEIIMKLLKKRPEDRFTQWDEVMGLLSSEQKSTPVDVNSLVLKAQSTDQAEEAKRIIMEKQKREQDDKENLLKYSVGILRNEIEMLVSAFNDSTTTDRMRIDGDVDGHGFTVQTIKQGKTIVCKCFISGLVRQASEYTRIFGGDRTIQVPLKLNNKDVLFWGYFVASGGRGFNIVLTLDNDFDSYGTWKILFHAENSMGQRSGRPSPFPLTDWHELSERVSRMDAMDVIDTDQEQFSLEAVKFLFSDIL